MDSLINLAQFKTKKQLEEYATAQFLALQSAAVQIKKLQEEVTHLQKLLSDTVPQLGDSKVETLIKTPEQCIIDAQIGLLMQRAIQKELTLEETKQLDLLIKNKRLLSGDSTEISGEKVKNKKSIPEAQLIRLARLEDTKGG